MVDMPQIPWDGAKGQRIHMYLRQTHQIYPSIVEMCKFIQITKSAREKPMVQFIHKLLYIQRVIDAFLIMRDDKWFTGPQISLQYSKIGFIVWPNTWRVYMACDIKGTALWHHENLLFLDTS